MEAIRLPGSQQPAYADQSTQTELTYPPLLSDSQVSPKTIASRVDSLRGLRTPAASMATPRSSLKSPGIQRANSRRNVSLRSPKASLSSTEPRDYFSSPVQGSASDPAFITPATPEMLRPSAHRMPVSTSSKGSPSTKSSFDTDRSRYSSREDDDGAGNLGTRASSIREDAKKPTPCPSPSRRSRQRYSAGDDMAKNEQGTESSASTHRRSDDSGTDNKRTRPLFRKMRNTNSTSSIACK